MPERHLLPIPLPHGRTGTTGHLSVYMSPRLRESGPITDYLEWTRWPDVVNAPGFQIRVQVDGGQVPARVVSDPPDQALWASTFRLDTPVRAHHFEDWTKVDLVEVPDSNMRDALLDLYTDMAVAHRDHPPGGVGLLDLPASHLVTDDDGVLDQTLEALAPMEGDDVLEAPRDPAWDFHRYLSLLGAHPELLRRLGLIIDLEVRLTSPPSSVSVQTDYPTMFGGAGAFEIPVEMRTTGDFLALPNPNAEYREQRDGFLLLGGAVPSILDTANSAARLAGLAAHAGSGDGALPVLSTRALTLVRPDQTKKLANRLQRQAEVEEEVVGYLGGGPVPVTYAEDVARGHRIDVLDHTEDDVDGPTWHSLFERTSAEGYHFPDDPGLDFEADDDEGWAQLLLSTEIAEELDEPNPDTYDPIVRTAPHRTTEALYRWDNWSGAVPRPSNRIDAGGNLVAPDDGLPIPDEQPVRFAVDYQARPGSLPRLRCSHPYQMRARAVDLSGWSPAVTEKSPEGVDTPTETFGRLEPIAAPTVVRRDARPTPGIGDTASTIVLKSDYDIDDSVVPDQDRLLFPQPIGHDLTELHGLPEGGAHSASHGEIAARSAAAPEDGWTFDDATGEPIAGNSTRHELAYLVDPMVGRLRLEHHGERQDYSVDPTGAWPELMSSRVVAVAGGGDTEVNPTDDIDLRVHVPKAEITSLDASYAPPGDMLEHFGLWHQFTEDEQNDLVDPIGSGAHWMFSSRQRVGLVHAVRRPLSAPSTVALGLFDREADSTAIGFDATVAADRRSTGAIALRAAWTDLVDDPSQPTPEPRPATTLLGRFDTPRSTTATEFEITGHRSELGDTKRHLGFVEVEAYSAFSHYFTEQRTITIDTRGSTLLDERGVQKRSVVVIDSDGRRADPRADFLVHASAGKLNFPVGSTLRDGDSAVVQFVPMPFSRHSDEHGLGYEILIPNTATPPAVTVIESAPAFARTVGDTIEHDGRVVRVHLARPWNLTGDGESLAVVVDPSGETGTRVARDPIVSNRSEVSDVTVGDFPRATTTATAADGHHELAIHEPVFDDVLGHWIVDIEIATPLYRPFAQLVIARYQPDSIAGRHDGPAITLEPTRLGVARSVKHAVSGDAHTITVTGPDHDGKPKVPDETATNEIMVRLQHADPTISDLDLRWTTDVHSVELVRTAGAVDSEWSGTIDAPQANVPRRIVIEEFEPAMVRGEPPTVGGQIVYTEIIDIG